MKIIKKKSKHNQLSLDKQKSIIIGDLEEVQYKLNHRLESLWRKEQIAVDNALRFLKRLKLKEKKK